MDLIKSGQRAIIFFQKEENIVEISCIIDRPDLNRVNILARRISGPSVQKEVLKWQKQAKSTK